MVLDVRTPAEEYLYYRALVIAAHEVVVHTARAAVTAAEEAQDWASLDLATRRIAVHEKTRWMLRAMAEAE